ncbi:hypothetical protein E2C01_072185 [Portunus trituberculatus]|uniref:Uncharacterized protein n=1 Tax=Portunus trituberculatus TaxID=210409 RepID=A0A5B7HZ88_PORTR|nr:hypothetical protein [Portunus trituberculatus]
MVCLVDMQRTTTTRTHYYTSRCVNKTIVMLALMDLPTPLHMCRHRARPSCPPHPRHNAYRRTARHFIYPRSLSSLTSKDQPRCQNNPTVHLRLLWLAGGALWALEL